MVDQSPSTKVSIVFSTRLATAVIQAISLYFLTDAATAPRSWPATDPWLFEPLFLVSIYVPLLTLLGLGQIRLRPLSAWLFSAAVMVAGLGYHDATRGRVGAYSGADLFWPWFGLWPTLSAGLFIAHVLVVDAVIERRLVPPYARHYDTAWKQGVQTVLAALFVGVFWGVLHLGAGLFKLVDIDYFQRMIAHRWFAYPATTLALAVAIHVSDVQPALIRGARTLTLTLLSWLLPLLVAILGGFLLSLPFISLAPLWRTHFATSLLLTTAGLLVFLINCSYQDGTTERTGSRIKRMAGTTGSLLMVPLVGLAVWALVLRVGQYGWTAERVQAAAIIVVAACYAAGYASATIWASTWLKRIEVTNFATAYVVLALILALFSSVADPARLMVADQLARLKSGMVSLEKFDFAALKFDGARWGAAALAELSHETGIADAVTVNSKAQQALLMTNRTVPKPVAPVEVAGRIMVYPADRTLPTSFFDLQSGPLAGMANIGCLRAGPMKCIARFVALHPGEPESIVFIDTFGGSVFQRTPSGQWDKVAQISGLVGCAATRDGIASGNFELDPHPLPDLIVGNQRLVTTTPYQPCPPLSE